MDRQIGARQNVRHGKQCSTLPLSYIWNLASGFVAVTLLYDKKQLGPAGTASGGRLLFS
jgi:hypothetical protein